MRAPLPGQVIHNGTPVYPSAAAQAADIVAAIAADPTCHPWMAGVLAAAGWHVIAPHPPTEGHTP